MATVKETAATPTDETKAVAARGYRKSRRGYVTSDKMDKTIVVEVEDRVKHPCTARSSAARPRSRSTTRRTPPESATSSSSARPVP